MQFFVGVHNMAVRHAHGRVRIRLLHAALRAAVPGVGPGGRGCLRVCAAFILIFHLRQQVVNFRFCSAILTAVIQAAHVGVQVVILISGRA